MNFKNFVRVNDMVNEVLDFNQDSPIGLNIKWEPVLDKQLSHDHYRAAFTVENDPYYVGFTKVSHKKVSDYYVVWDLDRSAMSWWWVIKSLFNGQYKQFSRTHMQGKKGLRYTLSVIKSVFACIHDFVQVIKPSVIQYDEADQDLKKFYDRITAKIAPKFGYRPHKNMLIRIDSQDKPAIRSLIRKQS
jgi:hypothetical protein